MSPLSRRSFLRGAGVAGLGLVLASTPSFATTAAPVVRAVDADRLLFPQSVASGDPTATGVVVWTRLAPAAVARRLPLFLEVARDDAFADVVLRRVVKASDVDPARGGTVRVDLDGLLPTNAWLFYRFVHDGTASRTGRCRTAPARGQAVDRLRLGVFTCQNYPNGFFAAYRHALADDLDYLVHVGDFIYESQSTGNANGRDVVLPSGQSRMSSYADVAAVHQLYRDDPDLQLALERHTLIPTWDDHETVNNIYYDYARDAPASASHPRGDDAEFMRRYVVEAAAAYHDWMPVRVFLERDEARPHDAWRLYRKVELGSLCDLFMLDGRWYRDVQPATGRDSTDVLEERAQDGTMLGRRQAAWLAEGIETSTATWRVLGNQTLFQQWGVMLPDPARVYVNMDAWDGYRTERDTVVSALARRPAGNLILTGDMHAFVWGYVQTRYGAEAALGQRVAVEIMTSSVTSSGLSTPQPLAEEAVEAAMLSANPHMQLFNWTRNGYTVVELTPTHADVTAYVVDRETADAGRSVYQRGRVPADRVELVVTERNSPSGLPATVPARPDLPPAAPPTRTVRTVEQLEQLLT